MTTDQNMVRPIEWTDEGLRLLDQRLLPAEETYLVLRDSAGVAAAIRDMVVRGAPAIAIAAAYGVVLSARRHAGGPDWRQRVATDIGVLGETRPTAVNLRWALDRMSAVLRREDADPGRLLAEARDIHDGDLAANLAMAEAGAALLPEGVRVLTHCNTGALATGGHGTALGVIRTAHAQGKLGAVYAGETRPWLQGARLTVWELQRDGIPVTLICDSAAASLMQQGKVDWVIVGADRIAANGDVANKIGTYSLAVLARHHNVKFMIAAPTGTVDMTTARGRDIAIEYRPGEELTRPAGLSAEGVVTWNPVFDITPAELVDVIVTETDTVERPDSRRMRAAFR